ncbi:MAG: DNA topoisomerase 3 [Bacteroidaceae bacterium]|nr:DNA topoisomerase 3 [Bacteroidaceae bacterium]
MVVCIAEKPSVARDIAKVLGATHERGGFMEGNGYQVTWTFGHLCELKEPHEYSPLWKQWSLAQLPMIPPRFGIKLKEDKGIEKQFATIEQLMQAADSIINCGDAGQEGELIQRWVMQKAGAKCPVQRLWISSLTEEAIREGFQTLKDQREYQSLYEAGLCRAIGDWTLGMNATRLYTLKYGQNGRNRQVLSIGRVQTPTLALIVNRQHEIDNFKPETYWVLTTKYRDTVFSAVMEEGDRGFKSQEEGQKALDAIRELPFTVTSVEKKAGKEAPPRLFDLTSLQVECNKRFGYSAEQTLQLIQSLYEKKVATYPRVDTTFLPDDVYPKCPQILAAMTPYAGFIQPLTASSKPLPKSKKVFDNSKVTDHHAIIPTPVPVTSVGLTNFEKHVYDLIARRFIGVFYPECKFEQTTVLGEVRSEGLKAGTFDDVIPFKATGKRITDPAWHILWEKKKPATPSPSTATVPSESPEGQADDNPESPDSVERSLPAFKKGESGPHEPNLAEKQTTPPKPYTEATLLRAMETAGKLVENDELRDALKENGIGRPSTRAAIIETLFKRDYIRRKGKSIAPTPTGIELISLIHEELLKSAELTGLWEKKLRQIERHEYDAKTFIEELKQMVSDIVLAVLNDNSNRHVTSAEGNK